MDDEIKKVIITLCTWLRTFSDYNNLNKCIIEMLDGLQVITFDMVVWYLTETIVLHNKLSQVFCSILFFFLGNEKVYFVNGNLKSIN